MKKGFSHSVSAGCTIITQFDFVCLPRSCGYLEGRAPKR